MRAGASSLLPSPTGERQLKVETDLSGDSPRRHIVRAAERGKEVVECVFIRDVDDGQLRAHFVLIPAEQVIVSHTKVEKTPGRDALGVVVVILGVWCWHREERRPEL